jgi:hypothetical protein
MIEFRTRSKQRALADLVAKLETLPENDSEERWLLIRMIFGLRHELERGPPIQGDRFD